MAKQSEIAAHLDLSESHVRKLLRDRVLPAGKGRGAYSIDDCRTAYIRYLRAESRKPMHEVDALDAVPGTLDYEKIRLTKEQADAQELKNEQARANLVPIELLTAILAKVAGEWATLVDALPLTIKRKHPALGSMVIEDIKRHCVKLQNSVARLDNVAEQAVEEHADSIGAD